LIDEIGAWEREHAGDPTEPYEYYERWLATLERLLAETGMVSGDEIEARVLDIAAEDDHDH
jgi:hypothetical protein